MKLLRILKNNTAISRTLLISLIVFGLMIPLATKAIAGFPQNEPAHRIALSISDSDTPYLTSEQLNDIRKIGIDLLELSFPTSIPAEDLDSFYLLLDSGLRYTLEYKLKKDPESIVNSVRSSYNNVPAQLRDHITAIKVFEFPADYRPSFPSSSDSLLSQLSTSVDQPLYYQSAFSTPEYPVQNVDFYAGRITVQPDGLPSDPSTVVFFEPSDNDVESLQALEILLNRSLSQDDSIVIISVDWFLDRTESQASFSTIISSYLDGEPIDFPMPAATSESPDPNWPIILFLLIWASFILHYTYQPLYKTALPRYFFNHSFFVYDVMKHRIHNATQGVVLLLQHAFLTGFLFYLLGDGFMSDTGLHSLSHHYPILFFPGFEKVSIFVIGMFIAIISHIISIAWLYFPNKQLKQLNQAINLYSWPFHISLIIVTVAVYIVQVQSARNWTIAIVIIYFFFWFSGFIAAAIDSARSPKKFRTVNLFLTVGLYVLLVLIIFVISFWVPAIYQPFEIAFMLP